MQNFYTYLLLLIYKLVSDIGEKTPLAVTNQIFKKNIYLYNYIPSLASIFSVIHLLTYILNTKRRKNKSSKNTNYQKIYQYKMYKGVSWLKCRQFSLSKHSNGLQSKNLFDLIFSGQKRRSLSIKWHWNLSK